MVGVEGRAGDADDKEDKGGEFRDGAKFKCQSIRIAYAAELRRHVQPIEFGTEDRAIGIICSVDALIKGVDLDVPVIRAWTIE